MTTREKQKQQAYMENYKAMIQQLHILSRMAVRQFLGTRAEGDPRVNYLTGLESFKNLANVQIQVLLNLATEKLGVSKADFLKAQEEILTEQIKAMAEDLGVTGWNDDGTPKLDLQAHRAKTGGWPL